MYKVTDKEFENWDERRYGKPLVKMEDEYGGRCVIAEDDHCYVLFCGSAKRDFTSVKHWYREAALALKDLIGQGHSLLR